MGFSLRVFAASAPLRFEKRGQETYFVLQATLFSGGLGNKYPVPVFHRCGGGRVGLWNGSDVEIPAPEPCLAVVKISICKSLVPQSLCFAFRRLPSVVINRIDAFLEGARIQFILSILVRQVKPGQSCDLKGGHLGNCPLDK
jgi:hypothetical protein